MRLLLLLSFSFFLIAELNTSVHGWFISTIVQKVQKIRDIRENIYKIRNDIRSVLGMQGLLPHETILEKLFPESVGLLKRRVERLRQCYSANVNGKDVSIFHTPILTVIEEYLVSKI